MNECLEVQSGTLEDCKPTSNDHADTSTGTGEDIPQGVGIEDSTGTNDGSYAEESLL